MKAVALFSGGLDSLLAIKVIQSQGIDVVAVAFRSPFFINDEKMKNMEKVAKEQRFEINFIDFDKDYLKIVKDPKHGHGKNMNPCIDCHAFMAKKAAEYADEIGAKFVFTGEVLDERPMSQNLGSLHIVENESGLKGKLLRPLSARLLPETEAEKKGYVDRTNLLDFRGRGRKRQMELAKQFGIKKYESPGGGCLLTNEAYAGKVSDVFKNNKNPSLKDFRILKAGRHFRFGKNKIIVGRNKEDNEKLLKMKNDEDYIFEAKDVVGPITILQGPKTKKAFLVAGGITARYTDSKEESVLISYGKKRLDKEARFNKLKEEEIIKLRV